tara:strand:- start:7176 stop:7451 length:276 start_codon:yes stop_codon:yes gene_type:complete
MIENLISLFEIFVRFFINTPFIGTLFSWAFIGYLFKIDTGLVHWLVINDIQNKWIYYPVFSLHAFYYFFLFLLYSYIFFFWFIRDIMWLFF